MISNCSKFSTRSYPQAALSYPQGFTCEIYHIANVRFTPLRIIFCRPSMIGYLYQVKKEGSQ